MKKTKQEGQVFLKKINTESVVQQVINTLTEAMLERRLRPGDRIPTETELAESLGVGRNSIREAIKILVYLGVLEIRRAEGTFVCEGFSEGMIDPMIYGIILDKEDSYENLMELRELLEAGVMRLAMQKADGADRANLKERLDALEAEIAEGEENVDHIFQTDNTFHDAITGMAKNPLVTKIDKVVRTLTYSIRYDSVKGMMESGRGQELYDAHRKIYEMIEKNDISDVNTSVRKTYFTDVGMQAGKRVPKNIEDNA